MSDAAERPAKSWKEAKKSRFLSADLLAGKRVTLTIAAAVVTQIESDEDGTVESGLIVRFRETPKEWRMNSTNGQCLAALFGEDPQASVGHRVTIYPARTRYGKLDVDGIRVWGSPELSTDRVVEIILPQRRPQKMTLHAVRAESPAAPAPTREPGSDDE